MEYRNYLKNMSTDDQQSLQQESGPRRMKQKSFKQVPAPPHIERADLYAFTEWALSQKFLESNTRASYVKSAKGLSRRYPGFNALS